MKKIIIAGILIFSFCIHYSSQDLSPEDHLVLAQKKLQDLIVPDDPASPFFKKACSIINEALLKYRQYRLASEQEEVSQQEEHILMSPAEHLYIAGDEMAQTRAAIMIASHSLTIEQSNGLQLLTESVQLVDDALKQLESTSLWKVHWMPGARLIVSAPPDLAWRLPLESELLRLVRTGPDDKPAALFYIYRVPDEEIAKIPEKGYIDSSIQRFKKRFPDMAIIDRAEPAKSKYSFTYEYLWEGELIRSHVAIHSFKDLIIELNYAAPSAIFDHAEAMAIIDSLKMIRQ